MRASGGPVPRLALFPYPASSPLVPTGVASSQPPADDEKDLRCLAARPLHVPSSGKCPVFTGQISTEPPLCARPPEGPRGVE